MANIDIVTHDTVIILINTMVPIIITLIHTIIMHTNKDLMKDATLKNIKKETSLVNNTEAVN
jgi:hypothetical protein